MKKLYEDFISMFDNKKLDLKIVELEKEIGEIRELTTNNYWKLKKDLDKRIKSNTKKKVTN